MSTVMRPTRSAAWMLRCGCCHTTSHPGRETGNVSLLLTATEQWEESKEKPIPNGRLRNETGLETSRKTVINIRNLYK